jgi:tetratricopeptide (TPR) repeat protein
MIIRDEEQNLPKSLLPAAGSFDQIVVVDTGSLDSSPRIARQAGAEVIFHKWQDDFSLARNFGLKLFKTDYIFWLDGDNSFEPGELARFRPELSLNPTVYLAEEKVIPQGDRILQKRIFPNRPEVYFTGRIHEQLTHPAFFPVIKSPLQILHWGYADLKAAKAKGERNLKLLLKNPLSCKTDFYILYQTGRTLFNLKRFDEAVSWLELAAGKPDNPSLAGHARIMLSQIYRKQGHFQKAGACLKTLTDQRPDYGPGRYYLGRLLAELKPESAAAELSRALELDLNDPAWGADGEKLAYTAAFLLGSLQKKACNSSGAKAAFEKAAGIYPRRPEPKVELARLALAEGQNKAAKDYLALALAAAPGYRSALKLIDRIGAQ